MLVQFLGLLILLVEKILLCGITACPPHKDIRKSGLGSDSSVKWKHYSNTVDAVNTLIKKSILLFLWNKLTSLTH